MTLSLIDRINNTGAMSYKSAYTGYGTFGDWLFRRASSNTVELTDSKYDLALAYLYIEPVRDSIDLYGDAMQRIPTLLVQNTTGNEDDDKTIASTADVGKPRHPAIETFKKHKRDYFIGYFMQQVMELMLYNEVVTELIRPDDTVQRLMARRAGIVNGLKVLRGAAVTVNAYSGEIHAFYYNSDEPDKTVLDPADVAYMKGYHPLTDYSGASKLLAVLAENNIIRQNRAYALRSLKKAHRPDVLLTAATADGKATHLHPDEMDQIEREVRRYREDDNMTMLLLGAPLSALQIPPPSPSNQVPLTEDARKAVYRVYGVNPDLVGDSGSVNYKQEPGIYANFVTNQVKPVLDKIYEYNNINILPQLPGVDATMRLKPDLSAFDVVTEPERDYIDVQTQALEKGVITFKTYGEKTNQDVPEILHGMVMVENIPVPLSEVVNLWKYKWQAPAASDFASAAESEANAEAKPVETQATVTEAKKPDPEPPAPPQPEPQPEAVAPDRPAEQKSLYDEIMTWQKYAKKRIKSGQVNDALTFETSIIPVLLQAQIRGALKSVDDNLFVEAVFDDALRWCHDARYS